MINAVEQYPGHIDQLESYIRILENEQAKFMQENKQLRERVAELESQVFGGSTK
jgi:cell division septum initiation protein DivIVA